MTLRKLWAEAWRPLVFIAVLSLAFERAFTAIHWLMQGGLA